MLHTSHQKFGINPKFSATEETKSRINRTLDFQALDFFHPHPEITRSSTARKVCPGLTKAWQSLFHPFFHLSRVHTSNGRSENPKRRWWNLTFSRFDVSNLVSIPKISAIKEMWWKSCKPLKLIGFQILVIARSSLLNACRWRFADSRRWKPEQVGPAPIIHISYILFGSLYYLMWLLLKWQKCTQLSRKQITILALSGSRGNASASGSQAVSPGKGEPTAPVEASDHMCCLPKRLCFEELYKIWKCFQK